MHGPVAHVQLERSPVYTDFRSFEVLIVLPLYEGGGAWQALESGVRYQCEVFD